jgi:hypothetical protein
VLRHRSSRWWTRRTYICSGKGNNPATPGNSIITTFKMTRSLLQSLTLLAATTVVVAQLPANVTDLKTIGLDDGRAVRYKTPELCETTEGVNSYSGFVDITDDKHLFFWFFETRGDKESDPTTLWLNGGPVSQANSGDLDN